MSGNTFGHNFKITTAGESHGKANLVIIDGVPPGIPFSSDDLLFDLSRRRTGQSLLTSQRLEADEAVILSGVFENHTTGTALAIMIPNTDQKSGDYLDIKDKYRPGHADFTYDSKFGFRDYRGGGRSSARETVARVCAGALAKKILAMQKIEVIAYVKQIGSIKATILDPEKIRLEDVEANIVRCPDSSKVNEMIELVEKMRRSQNSIGGIVEICAKGVPAGLGEPVFDKLRADLGKAFFSLPAVQGVEFGAGFAVAEKTALENNDIFYSEDSIIKTKTNNHGGMLGGISSGMPVIARCALKATSSIAQAQDTVDKEGKNTRILTKGRHDPCVLPRFVVMAEAMMAITLLDHLMRHQARKIF